ncbi:MAG: glycoside hydrolase family 2 protein [Bacteroidales bacterium]|nr:glycoside hydrolase family 2 protein [Bacteroidales bacterium]
MIMERDFIFGATVWNLADFGSENRGEATPHINNKGILSGTREPKSVYYLYKSYLSNDPVIHFTCRNWLNRKDFADNGKNWKLSPIKIYSNLDSVELMHNGLSLGFKNVIDHAVIWEVPLVNGKNRLIAKGNHNGELISDAAVINLDLLPENLNKGFNNLAINVGSHCYFIDPNTNLVWMPDKNMNKANMVI